MPDELDKEIDGFLNGFKEYGIDFFEEMKKLGIDEKTTRIHIRLMFDEELYKKVFGFTRDEHYLMGEGLTLEEARYVIQHLVWKMLKITAVITKKMVNAYSLDVLF